LNGAPCPGPSEAPSPPQSNFFCFVHGVERQWDDMPGNSSKPAPESSVSPGLSPGSSSDDPCSESPLPAPSGGCHSRGVHLAAPHRYRYWLLHGRAVGKEGSRCGEELPLRARDGVTSRRPCLQKRAPVPLGRAPRGRDRGGESETPFMEPSFFTSGLVNILFAHPLNCLFSSCYIVIWIAKSRSCFRSWHAQVKSLILFFLLHTYSVSWSNDVPRSNSALHLHRGCFYGNSGHCGI
jgi:hypothetical protein